MGTKDPVEVVRRYYEVMETNDPAQLADLIAPDFRWFCGGTHRYTAWVVSDEDKAEYFGRLQDFPPGATLELVEMKLYGDDLVLVHAKRTVTIDGDTLDGGDFVQVYRVEDGRVAEFVDLPGGRKNAFWTKHK